MKLGVCVWHICDITWSSRKNLKESHLENLCVEWNNIKIYVKETACGSQLDSSGSGSGQVGGRCEHSNELSGSIAFLDSFHKRGNLCSTDLFN